ncbi:Alpha/Beta hydrolase protein [Cercophora newfieldiana]|uniref:Alpha/Beta hydrolase protein n=1 Tax=Cercophora newfieldiana TaxID=92897 RepID=A0AA39XVI2_9PEZI|nr:Alpha/Beta hydrolase protein [Cercophora newfieldiana]
MDNTHLSEPSAEWLAFDTAHPELAINNIDDPPFDDPAAFRDAVNAAKEDSVRSLLARTGLSEKVTKRDFPVPVDGGRESINARVYRSKTTTNLNPPETALPAFIYFHGGGFLLGTPSTEDLPCSTWASLLGPGVLVVSVCYRHAPEYVFPAQQNDAWDAVQWVFDNAQMLGVDAARVVVGGVSSGGNLAAGVALRELDTAGSKKRVKGLVLGMPWLVHRDVHPYRGKEGEKSSMVQCRLAPIMPEARYNLFTDLLRADTTEKRQEFSVGLVGEERLQGMPPTAVLVCGRDMLRDEGVGFAERLEGVGTMTKKHMFQGLPHAFTRYYDLPSSKRFDELMVESIRWCLDDGREADRPGVWAMEKGEVLNSDQTL